MCVSSGLSKTQGRTCRVTRLGSGGPTQVAGYVPSSTSTPCLVESHTATSDATLSESAYQCWGSRPWFRTSYKLGFVRDTRARDPRLRIGLRLELWLAARGCPRGHVAGLSFGSPCLAVRAQVLPRWSSPDENSKSWSASRSPRPLQSTNCAL